MFLEDYTQPFNKKDSNNVLKASLVAVHCKESGQTENELARHLHRQLKTVRRMAPALQAISLAGKVVVGAGSSVPDVVRDDYYVPNGGALLGTTVSDIASYSAIIILTIMVMMMMMPTILEYISKKFDDIVVEVGAYFKLYRWLSRLLYS